MSTVQLSVSDCQIQLHLLRLLNLLQGSFPHAAHAYHRLPTDNRHTHMFQVQCTSTLVAIPHDTD